MLSLVHVHIFTLTDYIRGQHNENKIYYLQIPIFFTDYYPKYTLLHLSPRAFFKILQVYNLVRWLILISFSTVKKKIKNANENTGIPNTLKKSYKQPHIKAQNL